MKENKEGISQRKENDKSLEEKKTKIFVVKGFGRVPQSMGDENIVINDLNCFGRVL